MKILLAEDDVSIAHVAKLSLQKIGGHEVVVASDGQDAVEKAQADKFDLIILDGMMPRLDGFKACEQLKANDVTKDVPVIFLSAKNTEADMEEGYRIGGIGYIVKPFDARALCEDISKILNKVLWKKAT